MAISPVHIPDGHHVDFASRTIDLATFLFKGSTDFLITANVFPARRSDLNEDEIANALRVFIEEPSDAVYALGNSLRIVEPVHTDHRDASTRRTDQPLLRLPRLTILTKLREMFPVDADRISSCDGGAAFEGDRATGLVDFRAQFVFAIMQKAFEPLLRLKTNDVVE